MGGSNSASPVNFTSETPLPQAFSCNLENSPDITINNEKSAASLEQLQENFCVNNGVLSLTNFEHEESSKTQKNVTRSNIVSKNVNTPQVISDVDSKFTFNEDGSANLKLPREYLLNAQKHWDTSLIDHFIDGGFAFIFIREQAFKIWKN